MTRTHTCLDMAACADRGHRWRWVRTWHELGWVECATCGETRGGCRLRPESLAAVVAAPDLAPDLERAEARASALAEPSTSGFASSSEGGKPDLAAGQGAAPGMATAVRRPRQVVVGAGAPWASGRAERAQRDEDIRARFRAGQTRRLIAAEFGITVARVYQITKGST